MKSKVIGYADFPQPYLRKDVDLVNFNSRIPRDLDTRFRKVLSEKNDGIRQGDISEATNNALEDWIWKHDSCKERRGK